MSTQYGGPLLFKSEYVCKGSGSVYAPSFMKKIEDDFSKQQTASIQPLGLLPMSSMTNTSF